MRKAVYNFQEMPPEELIPRRIGQKLQTRR
jgi:hypothetical protein